MKILTAAFGILALTGAAFAGTPPVTGGETRSFVQCNLTQVCIDWDFSNSPQGFTTAICEPGGVNVWDWGIPAIPPPPPPYGPNMWGTVIGGSYPNNSGEGLISPPFDVTPACYLMEILHWYDIETNYDGGNVIVVGDPGNPIVPIGGYDGTISTSTSYYAYCVDMEPGFTGLSAGWVYDCFDLSAYMNQSIQVEFDFGSDSSVTYDGWYIAYVKIGNDEPVAVEDKTWGQIKTLYR